LDQIRTVDKSRLTKKIGVVEEKKAQEIADIIVEMFAY
jgi:mRNA-degrading endonuclease toxin of MazEF toxin-antitoxin module